MNLVAGIEVGITAMASHQDQADGRPLGVSAALVLVAGAYSLPLRHRFPAGVLAFTFVTTAGYFALPGSADGPVFLALAAALIHTVLAGRRWTAITCLVAGFVVFGLGEFIVDADPPPPLGLLALAAWLTALYSVPEVVRGRRERARDLAHTAEEARRRQVADERVRIARDIHDSVAHNMSLVSIQAGVALHLLESRKREDDSQAEGVPDQVSRSLAIIKEASKEALVELRSILGVLRHVDVQDLEDAAPGDESPEPGAPTKPVGDPLTSVPLAPVPGLDRVATLVDRARSAGIEVRLNLGTEEETLAALPRTIQVAAFRILQESLTNVSRHAGPTTATVGVSRLRLQETEGDDLWLLVEVLDEGPPVEGKWESLPGGGNGIVGMRERAAAVGGSLQAGPRPGRGFAVRALLPLGSASLDGAPWPAGTHVDDEQSRETAAEEASR